MPKDKRISAYKNLSENMKDFIDTHLKNVFDISSNRRKTTVKQKTSPKSNHLSDILKNKTYGEISGESAKNVTGDNYFDDYSEEFLSFLFPNFDTDTHNSFDFKDSHKAVDLILENIQNQNTICVYSDYDCDGVPGISMMRDFFESIKYEKVVYYIPDRHKEGYGLKTNVLQKLIDTEDIKLVITIDLGITNLEEVAFLNENKVKTIITDHHLPIVNEDGQILPKAFAILNPKVSGETYKDKNLCGSGVIFKLIDALYKKIIEDKIYKIKEGSHKWNLDLLSIGTIADMVPLIGENRVFSIYGLYVLSKTRRDGLRKLIENGKINLNDIKEDDIGFTIAPRVNAASRMENALHAFNMFSNNSKINVSSAMHLEKLNNERKESVVSAMKHIENELSMRNKNNELKDLIVIGSEKFSAGILGILAGKIVDKYGVTAFVYGGGEENFKGSVRSNGKHHIVELMHLSRDLFLNLGGHEEAGGFSISHKNVLNLESELKKNISKSLLKDKIKPEKVIYDINLADINSELLNALNLIGPFGMGNIKPEFRIKKIDFVNSTRFGKSKEHVKFEIMNESEKREVTVFFCDHEKEKELANKLCELSFVVEPGFRSSYPRLRFVN